MSTSREYKGRSIRSLGDQQVLDALGRVLGSVDFIASDRNRRFLSYVVEETLAGRAERLKGYSIALQVFGRDVSFDPQTDPLVRVEARRLRQALERYYLMSGHADPVRISIPKGGYVPVFENVMMAEAANRAPAGRSQQAEPQEAASAQRTRHVALSLGAATIVLAIALAIAAAVAIFVRNYAPASSQFASPAITPSVLVQPFSSLEANPVAEGLALGLTEQLTGTLARFRTLQVSSTSRSAEPPWSSRNASSSARQQYDYVISGFVRIVEQTTRVVVQLEDHPGGNLLWTRVFDEPARGSNPLDVQSEIAAQIATTLGDPYDVLFSNELKNVRSQGAAVFEPYACALRFYVYWLNPTRDEHRYLRDCHERSAEIMSLSSIVWTNLAWLYLDEHRFDYNRTDRTDPSLERAIEAAHRAVSLQPDSARAHLAVAIVQWFRKDFRDFDRHAELALSLNPNDATVNAELGLRYGLRGDWARSQPLVDRAISRDPIRWQTYRVSYAQHAVETGDFEKALEELRLAKILDHPVIQVLRAAIYGNLGRTDEARADWFAAAREIPRLRVEPRAWIDERSPSPALRRRILDGLEKAGLLPCDEQSERSGCAPDTVMPDGPS